MQTGTLFSGFVSDSSARIVPLDVYDYKFSATTPFRRICIKQTLGTLSAGSYTLKLDAATRNNQTGTNSKYDFTVLISNSGQSKKALDTTSFTFTSYKI